MKKIFVSLFIIAASLNAMATDFAVATLTLKGNTSLEEGEVTLVKTDDPAAASFCAPLYIDQYQVVMFAINGSEKYQVWANADLADLPLGIKTYTDANYTITVSNVSGSETLNLYDAVANQTIALTEGKTYEFTADPSQTITNRFSISNPAPGLPEICFTYNVLSLTNYIGAIVTIFKENETVATVTKNVDTNAKTDIDLKEKESGRYVVKIDLTNDGTIDEEYQIDVKPAVTVVP